MGGSLKALNKKLSQPITLDSSRLSAVGILILALVLSYLVLVYPLMQIKQEYQDEVDNLRFKLQKLQQVAGGRESLTQRLENIRELARQNDAFLPTNTAALASADLQTRIKQVVSEAGGELTSTQVIPERNEENAVRVGVKIRMTGSSEVLRQVLQNFESKKPYLFVENLNIRPIRMPRNPRDKNPIIEDRLSVDFDVSGYMQAP